MPAKNQDLHGNVPERAEAALLLIDTINDMEFPGGELLLPHAMEAAKHIAALKQRCRSAGVPALYVNDNFGRWQSDIGKLVTHVIDDGTRGRPIAEMLRPDLDQDYFVLKPKHSGFFSTTLDTLLQYLGARTLILTGFTADICVLFTANDAYMRDFNLLIPSDCVASLDPTENTHALEHMRRVLKADIRPSSGIDVKRFSSDKSVDREPREALPSQRGFRGR
jgi:nicotinamidase-related amidase